MKLLHSLSLEWYSTIKHSEKNNSSAPQIDIKTIASVSQYFRCYISWRATLFSHNLIRLNLPRDSKVGNFDISLAIKQDVVQFDISVKD